MAATRAQILESLLHQLNDFDDYVGNLLRAHRQHIAVSAEHVADSHAQMERIEKHARWQEEDNRAYWSYTSRR